MSQLISSSQLSLAILLEHMHKKFEIIQTKIKGGCQSGRKVVNHNSKSDLPLVSTSIYLDTHVQHELELLTCDVKADTFVCINWSRHGW